MGVFVGGCTLEAAEVVCNAEQPVGVDMLDALTSLVDKSLLRQREGPDREPHFTMFETIRDYAVDQLVVRSELAKLQQQHAAYYLTVAETARPELTGPQQALWLGRLEQEHGNLRSALQWALSQQEAETTLRFCGALWKFWQFHNHHDSGRQWIAAALAQPAPRSLPLTAQVLCGAGWLAYEKSDIASADHLFTESLTLARALDDPYSIGVALHGVGQIAHDHEEYDRACALYEESLQLFEHLGDTEEIGWSLEHLGKLALDRNNHAQASVLFERALAYLRRVGHIWGLAVALHDVGDMALHQGNYVRAQSVYDEVLALRRTLGDRRGIAAALYSQGLLAHDRGDYAAAHESLAESLALNRELGNDPESANVLAAFAEIASGSSQWERALRLAGAATNLSKTLGAPLPQRAQGRLERWVEPAHLMVDSEACATAWAEGQAMTLEQAIAYALEET